MKLTAGTVPSPATLAWARRELTLPVLIEDDGPAWTWRMLAGAASEVARRLGPRDGSRVTITAPNGGAIVAAMLGVWLAGGVPAPLSPKLPARERDRVLTAAGSSADIVHSGLGLPGTLLISDDFAACAPDPGLAPPRVRLNDPGIVLCTSGTTGTPKAVVHSMHAVWGQVDAVSRGEVDPDAPPEPVPGPPARVQCAPMNHIAALFAIVFTLWRGRGMVVMKRFEPVRYAELVRQHGIRTLNLVPSMIRMMLDSPVHSLAPARVVSTGTAALPPAWREEFEQRFGIPVQTTYGQTEAGTIAFEPLSDVLGGTRRPGTAGRVVPQIEIDIRDDAGRSLAPGADGHIWIRGAALPGAGWFDTGDLGRIDEDRYIYLTGRSRDLIIRGGLNIIPAEVENALLEHGNVREAVVTGRPDARLGEVPVAWVRTEPPLADGDELIAFVRDRLAAYKVPVSIWQVADFPRTDNGKIRRHELEGNARP
ncbi:class I adenylate-forming enzyme family protein [Amycolatopsis sp.]|uniref:class I adenylate-forming enzyme family protein n=1 Tax=Amycolatopsis sp. TaxID=37632 RepID=UPI002CDF0C05|nr:class I adenylate-forming enzyme family protein [Amycolatopsis sp.]HVV10500.1 class I adenylate-forming enzyme family protein [Amycolatopsis sp.]